jgi:SPP1 family predicted phage head-tail adaptor
MAFRAPRIGQMRKQVLFQKPKETRTTSGQAVVEWEDAFHAWANVQYARTQSGEEYLVDQLVVTNRIHLFVRHYYLKRINEKMRFLYNGFLYNILIIREAEETYKDYVEIVAHRQDI